METNMFTHNRDDVHRLSTANVIFIIYNKNGFANVTCYLLNEFSRSTKL